MSANVQPAELDDQFWVIVTVDGSELQPRGPFPDAMQLEPRRPSSVRFVARRCGSRCVSALCGSGSAAARLIWRIPPWVMSFY